MHPVPDEPELETRGVGEAAGNEKPEDRERNGDDDGDAGNNLRGQRDASAAHQQNLTDQQHHAEDADRGERGDPEHARRFRRERRKIGEMNADPGIDPHIFYRDHKQYRRKKPGEVQRKGFPDGWRKSSRSHSLPTQARKESTPNKPKLHQLNDKFFGKSAIVPVQAGLKRWTTWAVGTGQGELRPRDVAARRERSPPSGPEGVAT